jgi:hypothetical protein
MQALEKPYYSPQEYLELEVTTESHKFFPRMPLGSDKSSNDAQKIMED